MTIKLADLDKLSEEIKERCRRISEFNHDSLIDQSLFNAQETDRLRPLIQDTIITASELQELPLEKLTEGKLDALREFARLVELRFKELKETTDTINDRLAENSSDARQKWDDTRESFVRTLKSNCESLLEVAYSVVPFLKMETIGLERQDEETGRLISQLKKIIRDADTEIAAKRQEIEDTLQAARDITGQAGVAQHATTFGEIANQHGDASKRWLWAAVGFIILTVGIALLILFFFPAYGDFKEAAIIQRIIAKIVILSILYYGALWSAKNYRTHRHLAVLNAHRQSALRTFDAFIKAASGDDQTKNAVLLEATRCIFAPANTGYLGTDDDTQGNRIIEIFKMVGSSSAGK